jgi:TPP-dependent pyruvate/acetoin dehydrogenase alpha subunit
MRSRAHVRGAGPTFIEAYTYRWSGHDGPASDDLVGYRALEELEAWKRNCPIRLLEEALREKKQLTDAEKERLLREIEKEIDECFRFAKSSPFPSTPDWAALNFASATPEADRLLANIDLGEFDAHQESTQAKGYECVVIDGM